MKTTWFLDNKHLCFAVWLGDRASEVQSLTCSCRPLCDTADCTHSLRGGGFRLCSVLPPPSHRMRPMKAWLSRWPSHRHAPQLVSRLTSKQEQQGAVELPRTQPKQQFARCTGSDQVRVTKLCSTPIFLFKAHAQTESPHHFSVTSKCVWLDLNGIGGRWKDK